MVQTEAQRRASDKYNREKLDHIHLRMPKGKREIIQNHADTRGESLNGFINRAIDETMERDQANS